MTAAVKAKVASKEDMIMRIGMYDGSNSRICLKTGPIWPISKEETVSNENGQNDLEGPSAYLCTVETIRT